MGLGLLTLFVIVSFVKIQSVHNQYWSSCGSYEPYAYYGYGQPHYQTGYSGGYSQPGWDYCQSSCNPYRTEQPTVIVIEDGDTDDDDEWLNFLNLISSLQNQQYGPIYIPYPVPMSNCDNNYSDNICSDCGCKDRDCGCCNKCENYNTCDNGCDCNCGCQNQENRCRCNSKKTCSETNCNPKKNVIKHKCDCCCRI